MPLPCPICIRANPDEGLYCYHDGAALDRSGSREGPIAVGVQPFANPFVFPSGRFCRNFNELVLACEAHWEEARDLLGEGLLEGFFSGIGRADLSFAARKCAEEPDPDLALAHLLPKLPGDALKPALLAVQPLEINLGRMARGADHRFTVHLLNEGMGLLCGSVSCVGTEWLTLGEDAGAADKVFQIRHDQSLTVRVVGKRLRAGVRPQEGRLVVETNGGSAVVLVRVEAPAVAPFAGGVLTGAVTPRQLADKTKAAPREAAVYFENGAVARWYELNGWTYPVLGPPASGVAALQQFYEALGLAAPPQVELERPIISLEGSPGAALESAIVVHTSERRPVFAHATTAAPWLQIDQAVLSGRTAKIPVRVVEVPHRPGERLNGEVLVTANGNQRFTVQVTLTVAVEAVAVEDDRAPSVRSRRGSAVSSPRQRAAPAARRPGALAWVLAGGFLLLAAAAVAAVLAVVFLTPNESTPPAPAAQTPPTPPEKPAPKVEVVPPKDPPGPVAPPPPDVADIARLLSSDDASERVAAVRKLADMGPKAAPALHALLKAMTDGDADFRREVLLALPKIGAPTVAEVDILADLAADGTYAEGRAYALDALFALGADARPAATAVCAALKDRDPATRRKAAAVLGKMGAPAREGIYRDLVDALNDEDSMVGAAAAGALEVLGPTKPADAATLQLLLAGQAKTEIARRFALEGFRRLGPDAADYAVYLEDSVASDPSPDLRGRAIAALLAVQPTGRRSVDAFTKALADDNAEVQRAASEALAKVGPEHGALPGLLQALGAKDEAVRTTAEDALKAAALDPKQISEIGDALRTRNPGLRLRLMTLLKPLGAAAQPAVPGVAAVVRDGSPEARQQALALLNAMGPAARKASGALTALLEDNKFAVRLDAATTLAAIEGADAEEAIPVLMDALRVDNVDDLEQVAERARAVEALGRIGEPAVKPLLNALENDFVGGGTGMKGKINVEARLAAVKALQSMGSTANTFKALGVLANLQRADPSQAVRDAAKEARAAIRKE